MSFSLRRTLKSTAIDVLLLPERWRTGVAYNPLALFQDPYQFYARLRARSPVHYSRLLRSLLVSRYADVNRILRDHIHFSSDPDQRRVVKAVYKIPKRERSILLMDPPDHTRLRALVNKAFTRNAIRALEPRIRTLMEELLDAIEDPSNFDLIQTVAIPLPVLVIAEMLGIPREDLVRFRRWSAQRARLLEPILTKAERKTAEQATKELDDYFLSIIRMRRAEPQDDILTRLVQAEEQGDNLNEQEMINMLRLLLIAGNETTTNLIGNGMLALLRHPAQYQALNDDPDLIPAAVDELLRYDSPVQMTLRCALEDGDINGTPVRAGQDIIVLNGSANRDPAAFDNPDRLDFRRAQQEHISFGRGIHHCLGSMLARMEGHIAFEMLLERYGMLRLLTARPLFRNSIVLRGLEALPVGASTGRANA